MPQLPLSLDYIRQVLAEYFTDKPVRRVQVFGSYARGEATEESDLDLLLQSGVERQFEILGEAASHVSIDTQQLWPSIHWQGTKDFRVDLAKVWQVSQHTIHGLRMVLEDLFADLDRQFGPDASV